MGNTSRSPQWFLDAHLCELLRYGCLQPPKRAKRTQYFKLWLIINHKSNVLLYGTTYATTSANLSAATSSHILFIYFSVFCLIQVFKAWRLDRDRSWCLSALGRVCWWWLRRTFGASLWVYPKSAVTRLTAGTHCSCLCLAEGPGAGSGSVMSVFTDRALVKKEKLTDVVGNDKGRINNSLDHKYNPRPAEVIVKEACGWVGKVLPYSLTEQNCEHFVNELRYGKAESRQVGGTMAVLWMCRVR